MTDSPSIPATIDPDKLYDVVLTKPVTILGTLLLPRADHQMTGAFLMRLIRENADAVESATVVG